MVLEGGMMAVVGTPARSSTVGLLGAECSVGRRLAARFASDPSFVLRSVSPDEPDLASALAEVDTLVVLGPSTGPDVTGTGGSLLDLASIRTVLEAAGAARVGAIVALSSAMVYGAWPDNPVPLTEEAPLRPAAEATHAVSRAELERTLAEWSREHPAGAVAVLRPVVTISSDESTWLRRSPWARKGLEVSDADPPRQFLHADDLVAALVWAAEHRLAGAFNVAPDGWVAGDTFRELEGPTPRLRLGPAIAERLAAWGFRIGITQVPPGVLPYTVHPWVVANDRLEQTGWKPGFTSEEAFVEADAVPRWRSPGPRARQELSLLAAALAAAGAAIGVVAGVRRLRARRRSA